MDLGIRVTLLLATSTMTKEVLLAFIVEMNYAQASDAAPPFRYCNVGIINLEASDQVEISVTLASFNGQLRGVGRNHRVLLPAKFSSNSSVCPMV